MTLELIGLGKLLRMMYADRAEQVRLLRGDIRETIKKENGFPQGDGGDFYGPFWADAKGHVVGGVNLRERVRVRIDANKGRERLYELLRDGFLSWWEERRRLRNVPFTVIPENIRARFECLGLGVVKVENTLSITVGDDGHRVVYPYFIEDPALSAEAARLGLWVMSRAITGYEIEQMRILDVVRGRTFSVLDTPLTGDEERIFRERYEALLREWERLRTLYP
jgi:hypothetical protein